MEETPTKLPPLLWKMSYAGAELDIHPGLEAKRWLCESAPRGTGSEFMARKHDTPKGISASTNAVKASDALEGADGLDPGVCLTLGRLVEGLVSRER